MATEIVRPTSNINTLWNVNTFANIDDVVTQPTAGDGAICAAVDADDNEEQAWQSGTPSNSGTATAVKLWLYARTNAVTTNRTIRRRLKVNGTFTATSDVVTNQVLTWYSVEWTGSWDMSGLDVEIYCDPRTVDKSTQREIDVAYVDITYTPPATGHPRAAMHQNRMRLG